MNHEAHRSGQRRHAVYVACGCALLAWIMVVGADGPRLGRIQRTVFESARVSSTAEAVLLEARIDAWCREKRLQPGETATEDDTAMDATGLRVDATRVRRSWRQHLAQDAWVDVIVERDALSPEVMHLRVYAQLLGTSRELTRQEEVVDQLVDELGLAFQLRRRQN